MTEEEIHFTTSVSIIITCGKPHQRHRQKQFVQVRTTRKLVRILMLKVGCND